MGLNHQGSGTQTQADPAERARVGRRRFSGLFLTFLHRSLPASKTQATAASVRLG